MTRRREIALLGGALCALVALPVGASPSGPVWTPFASAPGESRAGMTESGAAASSGDSATPVPSVEKAPEGASGSPALPAARAVQAPRKEFEPFTFKRISAPVAGAAPAGARRITVQIDPDEQARRLATAALPLPENPIPRGAAAPGLGPVLPQPSDYDWYWNSVSPALGATDGRFPQALAALNAGPEGKHVPTPRSQKLQDIAAIHGREILSATVGTNVSPALVLAIISVESAGRADAVSSAGAAGLMQLIPATADRFGVDDRIDPSDNIKGGVAYLDWLMKEFNGDPLMVIAAYNAGENSVKGNAGVPPFAETRAYVPKVLAAWSVARGLCVTPPDLVTDGCVFAVNG